MEFKRSETDAPEELTFDQFVERVRAGGVRPDAWYRTPWGGDWRTVDNYPPFHRHSPVKYPLGPQLARELEEKAAAAERHRAWQANVERLRAAVTASYELRPLADYDGEHGVCGVSRLTIAPAFEPERIVTAVFTDSAIGVEIVGSRQPIWRYRPYQVVRASPFERGETVEVPGLPYSADEVVRGSGEVHYYERRGIMRTWGMFLRHALPLDSCQTPTLDGVSYVHEICAGGEVTAVHWANPRGPEFQNQVVVVRAYLELVRAARLGRLLRWREG